MKRTVSLLLVLVLILGLGASALAAPGRQVLPIQKPLMRCMAFMPELTIQVAAIFDRRPVIKSPNPERYPRSPSYLCSS